MVEQELVVVVGVSVREDKHWPFLHDNTMGGAPSTTRDHQTTTTTPPCFQHDNQDFNIASTPALLKLYREQIRLLHLWHIFSQLQPHPVPRTLRE